MHKNLAVRRKWSVLWRRPTHDSDYMLCIISYMLSSGSLFVLESTLSVSEKVVEAVFLLSKYTWPEPRELQYYIEEDFVF
jgi:hypothetical protein